MTVLKYDEDSNILCPECGRPVSLIVEGWWSRVPCWMENGEMQYSLFDGDWDGSDPVAFKCSGCGYEISGEVTFAIRKREKQGVLV